MNYTLLPGRPYPLGAKCNSKGTNFALYSEHATAVQVCLSSTSRATRQTAWTCASAPPSFGMVSSATSDQASATATASMAPGSLKKGFRFNAAEAPGRSLRRSHLRQDGLESPRSSPTRLRRATTSSAATRTMRTESRSPSWSYPTPSIGAKGLPAADPALGLQSSTKCTSKVSPFRNPNDP